MLCNKNYQRIKRKLQKKISCYKRERREKERARERERKKGRQNKREEKFLLSLTQKGFIRY